MAIEIGAPAPDFTLVDETGTPWTLSEQRGHNVVLVFYPLDFSGTCTRELKDLTRAAAQFTAAGAEVVGISVDSRHTHRAFKAAEELEARLLSDFHPKGAVAQMYDAWVEPLGFANRSTFVIDKAGVVRHITTTSPAEVRNQDEYLGALSSCPV